MIDSLSMFKHKKAPQYMIQLNKDSVTVYGNVLGSSDEMIQNTRSRLGQELHSTPCLLSFLQLVRSMDVGGENGVSCPTCWFAQ